MIAVLTRRYGVAVLALVVLCGVTPTAVRSQDAQEQRAITAANELSLAFRKVARDTLPGVVAIASTMKAEPLRRSPLDEEMFRRFFGDLEDFGGQEPFRTRPRARQVGQGSGFVIHNEGVIVTNSHVVNGAEEVTVFFSDGTELKADSWATDPWSDVAIVKVQANRPLTALRLANSDTTEIGDWVLALGDPFGVGTSVTAGIISGKGRAPGINRREDFLQTDAAINPGNSGGPLVNLHGEVVGVNAAISTRSGGYDGVGFAVPSNLVRRVVEQLREHGRVKRAYLGVAVQPLTPELRAQFGIEFGRGALVAQVYSDSPAQEAGLQAGDIILDLNGREVNSGVSLQALVETLEIGQEAKVRVLRSGQERVIPVPLREMPERFASSPRGGRAERRPEAGPATPESDALGLEVGEITPEIRESLGLGEADGGVEVTQVTPGGPADEAGLSRGDVIRRIGTTPVKNVEEFQVGIAKADQRDSVLLHVQGPRGSRFVIVKPRG